MDFSPEMLDALLGSGAMDDQQKMIMTQLAQAYALRNRPQSEHTTGAGAMFGGIGDVLRTYKGQQEANKLQDQHSQMIDAYVKALRGGNQAPPQGVPEMLARPPDGGP